MNRADGGEPTDPELMTKVVAGDRGAFGELYRRHSPMLHGTALKLCRGPGDAEDILHDVFLEAWRCAASYDVGRGSVGGWLCIRLKSRALDFLVRQRRRAALPGRCDAATTTTTRQTATDRLAVERAISVMKPGSAQLLIAAHVEQWTSTELGTAAGIPAATVKSRLAAAKDQFRWALRQPLALRR